MKRPSQLMLSHTALVLLLLTPAAASTQELDTAVSALVRISGTRGDTPVRGSGFVVRFDRDKATIVTAAHVIEGVQQLVVSFAVDPTQDYPAGIILGMDAGNLNGLAVFQVSGTLPARVAILSFAVDNQPRLGDDLFLAGFPAMALTPLTPRRTLSGRHGTLLMVDQGVGEGFSGGPVLQGGKVVGVVTVTDDQTTYAVNAVVAKVALEGWGPTPGKKCVPGERLHEASIDFVHICPGTFMMGSAEDDLQADKDEKPAHQVTLSAFWISRTEITNEQYRRFRSMHQGDANLPATNVSWADAKAACEHFGGHLPTEAQWEYAARAGSQTAWSFGDDEHLLSEYAWFGESVNGMPHPVGKKKPNSWGLYDMYGNVWEWVADWFGSYPYIVQTGYTGPTTGEYRTMRGGAFNFLANSLRSADRAWGQPLGQGKNTGFRCARAAS